MVPGELETNHSRVMPGFKLLNPVQNDAALKSQDKQTPQSSLAPGQGKEAQTQGALHSPGLLR